MKEELKQEVSIWSLLSVILKSKSEDPVKCPFLHIA